MAYVFLWDQKASVTPSKEQDTLSSFRVMIKSTNEKPKMPNTLMTVCLVNFGGITKLGGSLLDFLAEIKEVAAQPVFLFLFFYP